MGRTEKQLKFLTRGIKLGDTFARLGRFDWLARRSPGFRPQDMNVSFLPINEDIQLAENTVIPVEVLKDFVQRASHRVIIASCHCREGMSCNKYPVDIGCLFMGRAALEIHPSVGREASAEEALEHMQTAIAEGLVPVVGKVRYDNWLLGVKNKKQLLSVCFCCECCCIYRYTRHVPPPLRTERLHRLEGLRLEVSETCDGCGVCAAKCFVEAITIDNGLAVMGDGCVGCGRCASVCPINAITISLENPSFIEEARSRIESLVDIR